jgi:fibronectin-binding autotransporter adhesin
MKPRFSFFRSSPLQLAALVITISAPIQAETIYWDGSTDTSWLNAGNWTTSSIDPLLDPASAPGASDLAIFSISSTAPRTINMDGNQAVSGIGTSGLTGMLTLRGGAATARTLTIGAEGINHISGGITIGATTEETVDILLAASQSWNSDTSGTGSQAIRILNNISAASAGSKTLTLNGFNTGSYITGGISDGAGTVGITKTGTGVWELQGTNTYSGATQVNEGLLRLTGGSAASTNSAFSVANGATLSLKTANAEGTAGFSSAELSSFIPTINFASKSAVLAFDTSNGQFTYNDNLTGTYSLNKRGSGTLTLGGANSYTGETLITGGNIAFTNPAAVSPHSQITVTEGSYLIAYSGAGGFTQEQMDTLRTSAIYSDPTAAFGINTVNGAFNYSGALSGNHGFVKTGSNTLTFSGSTANTYTGPTYLVEGTLDLNKTAGVDAVAGDIRISNGTMRLQAANQIADTSAATISNGNLNFNGKAETLASIALTGKGSFNTGAGTVNVGTITRLGTTSKFTINSGGKVIADSITLNGDNIDFTKDGGNITVGAVSNSVVTELQIGSFGLSMSGQTIQVNASSGNNKGALITLGGDFTGIGDNYIDVYGTAVRAELAIGSGTRTFTINDTAGDDKSDTTLIGLNITGGILAKEGNGTLALKGDNSYTGVTSVNKGILRVESNTALGSNAAGTMVAAGGSVHLTNNVTIAGESLTINGLGLTTNSAGLVNVSGDNVWTGDITLEVTPQNTRISMTDGTLDIRGNVQITSTTGSAYGIVLTGDAGHGKVSGNISGTGNSQNLIKNGTSSWELSGTNTYTGVTRVDAGILNVNSIANNLGSPTTTANNVINLGEAAATGTFRYIGTGEETDRGFTLRSKSTGNGVIEQAGASGHLKITGAISRVESASNKSLTLQGSTAATGELSGAIDDHADAGVTNLIKAGTGTWFLTGLAKAYEGTTTVSGGTLNVSTALTHSTALTVDNGTFVINADQVLKEDATVSLGDNAVLQVAGFTNATGVLAVTGNALLHLAGGTNIITFADSSATDWTGGALSITGWTGLTAGADEIHFGGGSGLFSRSTFAEASEGLSDEQLGQITFVNPAGFAPGIYSSRLDGTLLVPDILIPEPSALLSFIAGGTALAVRRRRKD